MGQVNMFKHLWKSLKGLYGNILGAFHPVRVDVKQPTDDNDDSRYTVHTTYGFVIDIKCQEIEYKRRHRVTEDTMGTAKHIYRVFCQCSPTTPEPLKEVMEVPRYVPCMAAILSTKEDRHKQAIQTYLDLLNQELLKKGIV